MKSTTLVTVLGGLIIFSACTSKKNNPAIKGEDEAMPVEERIRPAGSGGTSAAYFSYTNTLDIADTLISVNSEIAGISQVHESYETEDGMMGMKEQQNPVIQPGETITFKQGGLHIMLMQLNEELATGDSVLIEFEFAQSGKVTKTLPVKN